MPESHTVDLVGRDRNQTSKTVQHLSLACPWQGRHSVISDVIQVYSGLHGRSIIFTSTKGEANSLALDSLIKHDAQVLHGDIAQSQREITLQNFRDGKCKCLVATDVAARGLDIPEVDLVIQCEPPTDIDAYIHRSGRTGRAGRDGVSVLLHKPNQRREIRQMERLAGCKFTPIVVPQEDEIFSAAARDASRFLGAVPEKMLPHFRSAAEVRSFARFAFASLCCLLSRNSVVARAR